jgi:RimJ/RimL family protein N-acetyltransferase
MDDSPPTLVTPRLTLRPWSLADIDDMLSYAADREWNRFLGLPEPYTRAAAAAFVARAVLTDWTRQPEFAIVHDGHAVGGVTLRIAADGKVAELGYSIARPLWGQGYMTEAAQAVVAWALEEYGLRRIWADAVTANFGSTRVMEKLGMQREAVLRGHFLLRGERVDFAWYGALRHELRLGPEPA